MTIGIDARIFGLSHAGIGRYVENLVLGLIDFDQASKYVIFANDSTIAQLTPLVNPNRVELVLAPITHYSLKEQTKLPSIFQTHPVDMMHFPHYNKPISYNRPYLVTIHDLLWHASKGNQVTTLSGPKYWVKYLGYRIVMSQSVSNARAIIVPSQYVHQQLLRYYPQLKSKIIKVIYQGIDHLNPVEISEKSESLNLSLDPGILPHPYFLYVGSVYPHKNLETLLKAMHLLSLQDVVLPRLLIACSRSVFLDRLEQVISQLNLNQHVTLLGKVTDAELNQLYQHALALIHPSLSEGFGFTGLEAMRHGCPVIASNAGSLPEIYGDAAIYLTEPKSPEAVATVLRHIIQFPDQLKGKINSGNQRVKKFSWSNTIQATHNLYQELLTK